ncbi:MAG: hypothetical protein R3B07_29565 [Polyangiaceae bacterium]
MQLRFRGVPVRSFLALSTALAVLPAACGGEVAGPTPEEVDTDLCAKASQLGCIGLNECKQSLAELRDDASKSGCASQADSALSCFAREFSDCSQGIEDVCPAEADAYDTCDHGSDPPDEACFGGGSASQCSVGCSDYSAECYTLANSQVECRCTAGPNMGLYFDADCTTIHSASLACR